MKNSRIMIIITCLSIVLSYIMTMQPSFAKTASQPTSSRIIKTVAAEKYDICSPVKNRKITSVFSKNRNGRPHKGTDYVSKTKCLNVYNFYKGMLACKGFERTMGNFVVIKHHVGGTIIYSTYMHLRSIKNISGNIKTGQIIGIMGNTGHSFGVHLHFQIGDTVPRIGTHVTFYNGDKMIANGFTFYNSERLITSKFGILK